MGGHHECVYLVHYRTPLPFLKFIQTHVTY